MSITRRKFGITKDGKQAMLYTLSNDNGVEAIVTDYGAILVSLFVPDKKGVKKDVVLGYDRLGDYEENGCYFGATIGRSANRIQGAAFKIDGTEYHIPDNENGNNLHTDYDHGFHKVMWGAKLLQNENAVCFSYESPDGENGFPGTLQISVTYALHANNALEIAYEGICDKKTLLNVTNHSYFNLGGHDSGSICDEKVMIRAAGFTEAGPGAIPTGKILPVEGTPMDFRQARRVGDGIDADWEQISMAQGYDHNWTLDTVPGRPEMVARVEDEKSGRVMEVYTDLPGVQFYTGNYITSQTGKGGACYDRRHGLCLETQYFPNSVNIPWFRQPILEAGQPYRATTIYKFIL